MSIDIMSTSSGSQPFSCKTAHAFSKQQGNGSIFDKKASFTDDLKVSASRLLAVALNRFLCKTAHALSKQQGNGSIFDKKASFTDALKVSASRLLAVAHNRFLLKRSPILLRDRSSNFCVFNSR